MAMPMDRVGCYQRLSTREVLLHLLDDFENTTKELVEGIATVACQRGSKTEPVEGVKKIVKKLVKKDKEIQDAVKVAEKQISTQHQIVRVKEDISKRDQEILQVHTQLKEAEQVLAAALFQAKQKLEATRQAKDAPVSSEDLIKFAFRISSGNSVEAPPDWQPGDPRRPYPLDMEMRGGFLGKLSLQQNKQEENQPDTKPTESMPGIPASQGNAPSLSLGMTDRGSDLERQDSLTLQQSLSWQASIPESDEALSVAPSNLMNTGFVLNGNREQEKTDDVEFMSSSSESSSSDSP